MTCELMARGDSLLHRADPRVKLICALVISFEIVFLRSLTALFFALVFALLTLVLSRLDNKLILRRLFVVNVFVLFMWLLIPWSTPGDLVFSVGPLSVTKQGLTTGLLITLKCNAIVIFNMALLSTSTIFALAHALDHLRVPSVLVQLFFFSWRYLHVLEDEYWRIKRAALVRGFKPGTNLLTYRTYANILGTLFVRSYDRGQRVYWAMACRGFNGTFWLLSHFHLKTRDFFLMMLMVVFVAILLISEWGTICHL